MVAGVLARPDPEVSVRPPSADSAYGGRLRRFVPYVPFAVGFAVNGTPAEPLQAEPWPTAYVRFEINYVAPRYQALKSQTFSTGRAVLLVRDGVA